MPVKPWLAVVAAGTVLNACGHWAAETGGEVSVSRPQVFTRERLLNERLGEVNWLREQLDRPFEQGFQGFRDVHEAAAFVLNLQAQYDAAQRRRNSLRNAEEDAQSSREQRLADLRQQIDETRLQQQLDALKKQTDVKPPEATVPDDLKEDLTRVSAQIRELVDKVDQLEKNLAPQSSAKGTAATLLDAAPSRLVNPGLVESSRASLSSRDRLEDEAAFRDLVNSRIREAILDDTHDLKGFALYELKFDATITPGSHTRRRAVAEIEVVRDSFEWDDSKVQSLNRLLIPRIAEDINALVMRQQDRAAPKVRNLNRAWQYRIVGHLPAFSADGEMAALRGRCGISPPATRPGAASPEMPAPSKEDLSRYLRSPGAQSRLPSAAPAATEASDESKAQWSYCLIADYVRDRMVKALGDHFTFDIALHEDPSGNKHPLLKVGGDDAAHRASLLSALKRMTPGSRPWVATVSPKEYAQNISDVASSQQIRQIAASLAYGDALGSTLKADAESYKQEQALAHAIKRQPLAASFVRGQDRFGWVLGPKYELSGTKPSFLHSTARYTFTASLAVPGWSSQIKLRGCGYWIEQDGSRSPPFPLFPDAPGDEGKACQSEVTVRLANSHRALFRALIDSTFDLFDDPEIYLLPDADDRTGVITVRATPASCAAADRGDKGCEQSIVIEGRDLWRNPAVFLGDQRADRVDVLPSMRGIVATWKALRLPASRPQGRSTPQDLFVSTSTGQDRLEGVVYIAPEAGEAPKPFARLRHPLLERAGTAGSLDITFEFPPAAFPRGFSAMALQVRKAGTTETPKQFSDVPDRAVGRLTYRIANPSELGFGDKSGDFEVDLMFKLSPSEDWISLSDPLARHAIYIANAAQREMTHGGPSSVDFSSGRSFGSKELEKLQQALSFSLPADEALFFKAYPGFAQALAGRAGEARIRLQIDDSAAPVELVAEGFRAANGKTIVRPRATSLSAHQLEILPEDEKASPFAITVVYRLGGGPWAPVAQAGSQQVTVTGLKKPAAVAAKVSATTSP